MDMPIFQLLYTSEHDHGRAPGGFSQVIYDIGLEATTANQRLDVTGFLICAPNWFSQILEGRRAAVEELMERIARDTRHRAVRIIRTAAAPVRLFPNWSMGLANYDTVTADVFERVGVDPGRLPRQDEADSLVLLARSLAGYLPPRREIGGRP